MRRFMPVVAFLGLVLLPVAALAQATITGVVRDASGAILPGVVVEAASDALIEKVRSAVTDGTGQFRIIDLRPGTYSVTFTLTGFQTTRREGVELEGQLTATVNADMRLGALEETITVTGETPIVDVQSVRRQATISGDIITAIPSARAYGAIMQLIPSLTVQASFTPGARDVQVTPAMSVFGGAGGRENEGRLQVDGINTGAPVNGGGVSSYVVDLTNSQEVAFTTSGGMGEAEVGGPAMSVVPKAGGNTLKGTMYVASATEGMVDSNYTDELRNAGLSVPGQLHEVVGHEHRRWRTRVPRSALVLRRPSRSGIASLGAGHVREPQRRRSDEVDLSAGSHAPVAHRVELSHRQPAPDHSGDAAQQVRCLLGRAEAVRRRAVVGARSRAAAISQRPDSSTAERRRSRLKPAAPEPAARAAAMWTASSASSRRRGRRRCRTAS